MFWLDFSSLRDLRVDAQHHILAFHRAGDLVGLLQDLADHRLHALDVSGALAIRAGRAQRALQALLDALAGDRHQAEIVELQNLVRSAIGAHGFFERLHHLLAILALVHVDEIDHDDAAQVAQPDLPHDLLDGIGVGLDDRVFQAVRLADEFAGVDVDGHQRLGLVDHDIAARFQPDLRPQRLLQLGGDVELVEDRDWCGCRA